MRKLAVVLTAIIMVAPLAWGGSGIGPFWSYFDPSDGEPGWGGGGKLKIELIPDALALELRGSYLFDFYDEGADEDLAVIPVEADLVFQIPVAPDLLLLYGGGGAGYYIFPQYSADHPVFGADVDHDPSDEIGFFAIGGIELRFSPDSPAALFAEAKYIWLDLDEIEIDGVDYDVDDGDWDGFGINAGLLLTW